MKLIEVIECEDKVDTMKVLHKCYVNPKNITYVSPHDKKGYTYIGIGPVVTIVKGSVQEIREKIEGKKWHKILRRRLYSMWATVLKLVSKFRLTKAHTAK